MLVSCRRSLRTSIIALCRRPWEIQNSGVQSSWSHDKTACSNTITSPSSKQLPFNAKHRTYY